jgi:urea transport system substrate-binding protein
LPVEIDLPTFLASEAVGTAATSARPPSSIFRRPSLSASAIARKPIKVGVLHSLTGTMAISERPVVDATLLAIDDLNQTGGVLGRQLLPVVADGASEEAGFATAAEKLILEDRVSVVFGCWTSDSRRTVRPIFERHGHLLFYPVQYEGLEQSPNIVYTGAAPNQQILPAVRWCTTVLDKKRLFLVGSDYVFPRCANAIIRDYAATLGAEVVGEAYLPLGGQDAGEMIRQIAAAKPDIILNTINGDSNVAFYRALRTLRSKPAELPVMSFSVAEEELRSLSAKEVAGDYAAWNYFMSLDREDNRDFIRRFQDRYGAHRVITDPMQAAYIAVQLWAQSAASAGTDDARAVRRAVAGQKINAPGGTVTIDSLTQHTFKVVRIGKIVDSSSFEVIFTSENPIAPTPYPVTRTPDQWHALLNDLYTGWHGHWAKQAD